MKRKMTTSSKWFIFVLALVLLLMPVAASAYGPGDGRGGSTNWHLYGTLTAMPDGDFVGEWAIDGEAFIANAQTIIVQENGELAIGAYVHAVGYVDGEAQVAYRIETLADYQDCCNDAETWRLYGVVDAMPDGLIGNWSIAGESMTATSDTNFRERFGELAVDAYVVSAGYFDDAGERIAMMIGTLSNQNGDDYHYGATWHAYGVVETMPESWFGPWTVAGQAFTATETTRFNEQHGPIDVGVAAHAVGYYDDGNAYAYSISSVDDSSGNDMGGGTPGDGDCDGDNPGGGGHGGGGGGGRRP